MSHGCQRQIKKNIITTGLNVGKKYVKKADTVKEVLPWLEISGEIE